MDLRAVSIDGMFKASAYVEDDERWNGWLCPVFPFDEAVKVLDESVESDLSSIESYRYDEDADTFFVKDADLGCELEYGAVEVIDIDNNVHVTYPIGSGEWGWNYDE